MDFACFVVFFIPTSYCVDPDNPEFLAFQVILNRIAVDRPPWFISGHHFLWISANAHDQGVVGAQTGKVTAFSDHSAPNLKRTRDALLKRDTMLQGVLRDDARERFLGRLVGKHLRAQVRRDFEVSCQWVLSVLFAILRAGSRPCQAKCCFPCG